MSRLPWNFILSPFDRFRYGMSKRISSAVWFLSWIIILLFEDWIDSIVPSYVECVVWARKIRRNVAVRDITKIVFWKFIVRKPRFSYELSCS